LLSVSLDFVFFAIDFLRFTPPVIFSFLGTDFLVALGSCKLISELDAPEAVNTRSVNGGGRGEEFVLKGGQYVHDSSPLRPY
jgi:hypothetical protein